MTAEAITIITAKTSLWKQKWYFQTFTVDALQEALDYLEDQNKMRTEGRRRAIWYEIQHRKKMARELGIPIEEVADVFEKNNPYYRYPRKGDQFVKDWNDVCTDIYQRIQFLPPIPLTARL